MLNDSWCVCEGQSLTAVSSWRRCALGCRGFCDCHPRITVAVHCVVLHDFAQVRYSASELAVEYLRAVDSRQVARNRLIACASDCSIDACLHVHGVIPSHP